MDEKHIALAQDARLLNLNQNIIFPKLDNLLQSRMMQMVGRFNAGEKEFIADAAYLAALISLKTDLQQTQNKGNAALAKMIEE